VTTGRRGGTPRRRPPSMWACRWRACCPARPG
jgi:hypothetical protein